MTAEAVGSAPPEPTGLLNGEGLLSRDSESFGPKFQGPEPTIKVGPDPGSCLSKRRRRAGGRIVANPCAERPETRNARWPISRRRA